MVCLKRNSSLANEKEKPFCWVGQRVAIVENETIVINIVLTLLSIYYSFYFIKKKNIVLTIEH